MKCIRFNCRRTAYRGMNVCRDCLECIVYGGPVTCATPAPAARPEASTAPVGLSELEMRYRFGDR